MRGGVGRRRFDGAFAYAESAGGEGRLFPFRRQLRARDTGGGQPRGYPFRGGDLRPLGGAAVYLFRRLSRRGQREKAQPGDRRAGIPLPFLSKSFGRGKNGFRRYGAPQRRQCGDDTLPPLPRYLAFGFARDRASPRRLSAASAGLDEGGAGGVCKEGKRSFPRRRNKF